MFAKIMFISELIPCTVLVILSITTQVMSDSALGLQMFGFETFFFTFYINSDMDVRHVSFILLASTRPAAANTLVERLCRIFTYLWLYC